MAVRHEKQILSVLTNPEAAQNCASCTKLRKLHKTAQAAQNCASCTKLRKLHKTTPYYYEQDTQTGSKITPNCHRFKQPSHTFPFHEPRPSIFGNSYAHAVQDRNQRFLVLYHLFAPRQGINRQFVAMVRLLAHGRVTGLLSGFGLLVASPHVAELSTHENPGLWLICRKTHRPRPVWATFWRL